MQHLVRLEKNLSWHYDFTAPPKGFWCQFNMLVESKDSKEFLLEVGEWIDLFQSGLFSTELWEKG